MLLSTLMIPSHRETTSRPLSRVLAAATLAILLTAQPWVVCAPLCLLNGHAKVALAASQYQDHVIHCHSDKVIQSELPHRAVARQYASHPMGSASSVAPRRDP